MEVVPVVVYSSSSSSSSIKANHCVHFHKNAGLQCVNFATLGLKVRMFLFYHKLSTLLYDFHITLLNKRIESQVIRLYEIQ